VRTLCGCAAPGLGCGLLHPWLQARCDDVRAPDAERVAVRTNTLRCGSLAHPGCRKSVARVATGRSNLHGKSLTARPCHAPTEMVQAECQRPARSGRMRVTRPLTRRLAPPSCRPLHPAARDQGGAPRRRGALLRLALAPRRGRRPGARARAAVAARGGALGRRVGAGVRPRGRRPRRRRGGRPCGRSSWPGRAADAVQLDGERCCSVVRTGRSGGRRRRQSGAGWGCGGGAAAARAVPVQGAGKLPRLGRRASLVLGSAHGVRARADLRSGCWRSACSHGV